MEVSNLQKIGKNKVVQRTSTCLSPIVKILPFWFYHLLVSFFFLIFFFFFCLFLYLPWSLLYSGSFPWPPLSFMALTWHVPEEYSLLPPLPFLIECSSFWGSLLDWGYAFLVRIPRWWYCVVRFRAYRVHLLFVGDVHFGHWVKVVFSLSNV